MTESNETTVKYTAGVKLSATMDTAMIVLLKGAGADAGIVGCETLTCSNHLQNIWHWLDKQTAGGSVTVAAGVDSSGIRFLNIRIPAVDESQQYPLIQTQAEAILPLSAEQTALAWRTERNSNGLFCRVAAARKELLTPVLAGTERVQAVSPEAVGLVMAWKHFGGTVKQPCILLHRRKHDFLAAMLKDGRLLQSAVIDADGADLQNGLPAGLLLQDILTEIEQMEAEFSQKLPLFILSENAQDNFLNALCTQIQSPDRKTEISPLENLSKQTIGLESLEAFGLALAAINAQQIDYNFRRVETLNQPKEIDINARTKLRKAIAVTIALLALVLGTSYWSMKKEVKLLNRVMAASHEELTVRQVLAEQAYRETVARARPDIVDLFQRIQKCQGDILLDTFEFEKGKPAKITATGNSYDATYQFQKELESQNKNVITNVRLLEPRLDQKGNKVKFTVTFHYRNFSK